MTSSRRDRQKQDKLRRIREAAWALFRERGFDGTTTRAIAERADIGTGTLFLYAKDKSDLLFLVFNDEIAGVAEARFSSVPTDAPLLPQLVHVFRGFLEIYADVRPLARRFIQLLVHMEGENRAAYEAMNLKFFAGVAELVEAAKTRGELRAEADTLRVVVTLFAVYAFFVLTWLTLDPAQSIEDGLAAMTPSLALVLDGAR